MTLSELQKQRDDLSFRMIEAEGRELYMLEEELVWVEELINEFERKQNTNGEEN